jgi:ribosomal protein L12E/L44/L45/RPP1/RPP2
MTPHQLNNWKHLAEQASIEVDPERFMALIQELNRVLLEREQMIYQQRRGNQPTSFEAATEAARNTAQP